MRQPVTDAVIQWLAEHDHSLTLVGPLLDGDESSASDELAVSMSLSISMTLAVEGLDDEDE
jgi:hypothetical protein